MTRPNVKLTKKQLVLLVIIAAGLLVFGILTAISGAVARTQSTQYSAKYWDPDGRYSMVSVFLPEGSGLEQDNVRQLEYALDQALIKEALEAPSDNARLYVSSYSVKTEASVSSQRSKSQTCTAYGVGGDFFRFHSYELISGSYLVEDSLMDDHVVLDEEAAWKIFGAIEVDGMTLKYDGKEYIVQGVVKPMDEFKSKAGGAESGTIFFPFSRIDGKAGCYEIIFPNPVSGFAAKQLKEAFKSCGYDENDIRIVDNSERYGFVNSVKRLVKWTDRGMSFKALKYPYWENSAIAVENIVDLLTLFRILFIVPPAVIVVISIICFHPLHRFKLLVLKIVEHFKK